MEGNSMVLDIQRFAEGGAEGAGTTGTSAEVGQPQNTGAAASAADDASVAGEQESSQTQIDLSSLTEEQIEELIDRSPNLKKVFGKRTDGIIGKRLAQERAKMKPTNDLMDKLMIVHGAKTMEELQEKLESSLSEEYAIQNGVDNDIGKKLMNAQLRALQDERDKAFRENQMKAERQLQQWQNEAGGVKEFYPDFNLEAELESRDFAELLKRGISMKHAYELMHMDDIKAAAERKAADAYSKSVNANLSRPVENGTGNQSAVSHSSDVSKLTKKERADMAKRAARGEVITFR